MATKAELIETIAKAISGYRKGEITEPDEAHVELWLEQFPEDDQKPVLSEMAHVLGKTYISRKTAKNFISSLISNPKLAGKEPKAFWRRVNFLDIQENGESQTDFLKLFNDSLNSQLGLQTDKCGGGDVYVYLDDVVFTGGRAGNDLKSWIRDHAPKSGTVHVIVMAHHTFGGWKMQERLKKAAVASEKKIDVKLWSAMELENRNKYRAKSDVLWPTSLPDAAKEYASGKYPFEPRAAGGVNKIFSGEVGRNALEQALLQAGMRIRGFSASPSVALRPLGFSPFGVGFGSTIVTYRNCPNNAPLALWWGDPSAGKGHPFSKWRPLVPRKTYGGEEF